MSEKGTVPLTDRGGLSPDAVLPQVTRRLIPFLFICYVIAYIDRVNIGFAASAMQRDLGLSDSVYGTGAGLFFLGYFLFEIPSNLILERVGARRWMARIMIVWGLVSMATMFVEGKWSFYGMRVLLGLAEAGFFPGAILYLTYWIPQRARAPQRGAVHDRDAGRDPGRRAALGPAHGARRRARSPRVAVAVSWRRAAGRHRRSGHAVLPDGPAGAGRVALATGARVADERNGARPRRRCARPR